jgi:hypothetical protein
MTTDNEKTEMAKTDVEPEKSFISEEDAKHEAALEKVQSELRNIAKTCQDLDDAYTKFHKQQSDALTNFKKQKKQLKRLKIASSKNIFSNRTTSSTDIATLQSYADTIQNSLPKKNNFYLSLIVGSELNVILPGKQAKILYKLSYENFKLKINSIQLVLTAILLLTYLSDKQVLQTIPFQLFLRIDNFLFLWYYCTVTVRESILIANGSKIKGWYITHHYLTILLSGLSVTVAQEIITDFGPSFLIYTSISNFISLLQFNYQRSALYNLKAMGEKSEETGKSISDELDLTTETGISKKVAGYVSLKVILPFLGCLYAFQLFNAIYLYKYARNADLELKLCWQIYAISVLFVVLFVGNVVTMGQVLKAKFSKSKTN